VRFSAVYNRLMDSYLLVDREAETSVKYFAVQLFTVPSIAEHIVKHSRMIDRLLSIIIAFFTNQISNKMIDISPRPDRIVNVDTPPFRSKRFMPIFSDLRYLCVNPAIQELIAHDETYITNFVRTCRLFVGINPNKRAVSNHVEYEQDAWISVFNVTLSLSRVVKAYAEAFSRGTTQKLCRALTIVAGDILSTCTLDVVGLDRQRYENIRWCDAVFGDVEYSIIDFDVSSRYVSFHHAQHWLFAELLKHVDLLHREKLAACGYRSVRDMLLRSLSERSILIILEFPLRGLQVLHFLLDLHSLLSVPSCGYDSPNPNRSLGP
jgi:E3 ubiquitin-protein ligase UBR1